MEALPSSLSNTKHLPTRGPTNIPTSKPFILPVPKTRHKLKFLFLSTSKLTLVPCTLRTSSASTKANPVPSATSTSPGKDSKNRHWMVLMESPPGGDVASKPDIVNYYVRTLEKVLGSERDAQMCMYDASVDTHFGFCCDIDEEASQELASLPGVLLVRRDPDYESVEKDYGSMVKLVPPSSGQDTSTCLFPAGTTKHWMVRVGKLGVGVVTKAQMVDHCAQLLSKVLGNEQDAQMCMYHVSWQSHFGFCCELDEECARELPGVPGVLSVDPDNNYGSDIKDYAGVDVATSAYQGSPTTIKTKKLFITGLSFYTSEKTLREAFQVFGELVEVKIIMDKISKRSKGYAFVEYTTEEAASVALKEMNGKIINGWMIVVDAAKTNPPSYSRGRPRPRT